MEVKSTPPPRAAAGATPLDLDEEALEVSERARRFAEEVTERDAGSDPSAIVAAAVPTPSGFRLNAEKWFVTAGDVASVYVVMANVTDGADRLPTLFVVDRDRPGVEIADDPAYT